jgi:hypothetical protein
LRRYISRWMGCWIAGEAISDLDGSACGIAVRRRARCFLFVSRKMTAIWRSSLTRSRVGLSTIQCGDSPGSTSATRWRPCNKPKKLENCNALKRPPTRESKSKKIMPKHRFTRSADHSRSIERSQNVSKDRKLLQALENRFNTETLVTDLTGYCMKTTDRIAL